MLYIKFIEEILKVMEHKILIIKLISKFTSYKNNNISKTKNFHNFVPLGK